MITWLALASLLGSGGFAARWVLGPKADVLGRPMRFPFLTVSLLLILACVAAYPGIARKAVEHRLGRVASMVAGARAVVRCQTLSGALVDVGAEAGYVLWGPDGRPEHVAHLKRDQCALLSSYQGSSKHHRPLDELIAVHVLTHEAIHISGVKAEALTECMAVQRDAQTARLLGASAGDARALAWLYWKTVYPRMPDDYRDGGCAPGGALDEHLATSPWIAGV